MFCEMNEEVYIKFNALKIKSLFNRRYIQIIDVSVSCLENIKFNFYINSIYLNKIKMIKKEFKNFVNMKTQIISGIIIIGIIIDLFTNSYLFNKNEN